MRVLIVDDESSIRTSTVMAIRAEGHQAESADNRAVCLQKIREEAYDLLFLDLRLGDEDGIEILQQIRRTAPQLPVVLFTAYATVSSAVSAMQKGAFDYLEKPFTPENLRQILSRVEKDRRLETRIVDLEEQVHQQNPPIELASQDPAMTRLLEVAFRAAPTQAAVLLQGESGTGKSVLARAIHERSNCASGPFVTVSCPSLSRELLESELFGHLRGSFTGAVRDTWGKVAAAETGTLFLDEIGELPLEVQPKLLRLLQERQYERLGEHRPRSTNARIVAATNRDLRESARQGLFREDLFYRLDVISLRIPPLRERPQDLPGLTQSFLQFFARQLGRTSLRLGKEALQRILHYAWPGNIRELRNTIERAVILSQGDEIDSEFFPVQTPLSADGGVTIGAEATLEEVEEAHIRKILGKASSLDAAAKTLGIDPATLYRKRKRMNI